MKEIDYTMGYGNPSHKHIQRIDKFISEEGETPEIFPEPPLNSSLETQEELEYLYVLQEEERPYMEDLIVKADQDLQSLFYELCAEYQIDPMKPVVENIMEKVSEIAAFMKYSYNRPRPFQLAWHYDIELYPMDSISAWSAAYPSGHTTQAEMLRLYYTNLYPELAEEFMRVAALISRTRMIGGMHYPSDIAAGILLARWFWS